MIDESQTLKSNSGSFSKKVKFHFISASGEGQAEVTVLQMYSKSVNERRNKA